MEGKFSIISLFIGCVVLCGIDGNNHVLFMFSFSVNGVLFCGGEGEFFGSPASSPGSFRMPGGSP